MLRPPVEPKMRKALNMMSDDHLLTRRKGLGTFVTDPASDERVNRFSKVCGMDGKPRTGRIEIASLTKDKANNAECGRLELRDEYLVWRIRRKRFHNQQVFMHEDVSLPAEHGQRAARRMASSPMPSRSQLSGPHWLTAG